MVKFRSSIISLALLFTTLIAHPHQAVATTQLTTCTDLGTGKSIVLQAPRKDCRPFQAKALWQSINDISESSNQAQLKVCTSKRTLFSYQIIKAQCARHQKTNNYVRDKKVPTAPIIASITAREDDGVVITLDTSRDESLSSPITYYLVTNLSTGISEKFSIGNQKTIYVGGLVAATFYSFKVAAVNADGISVSSAPSPQVQTAALPQANTSTVAARRYAVGDRGPGGGIIFYVAATPFSSPGSTCNPNCNYLEVAPSTWQSGVVQDDMNYAWSTNSLLTTGQDFTTAGTEGPLAYRANEKANWRIGQGFYNTSVMRVSGAVSDAQAAVLAYAGTDSSAGQWFIPSVNELNELCKYARGQATGNPTVACTSAGAINPYTGADEGGFISGIYWSSSEESASRARLINFSGVEAPRRTDKWADIYLRPIRAL